MIISTHLAICVGCMTSDFKIPPFFKHSYFCVCFQLGKGDGHIKERQFLYKLLRVSNRWVGISWKYAK